MTILEQLQNINAFYQMTFGDKILASLVVTALGMGLTFTVLLVLSQLVKIVSKVAIFIENSQKKAKNNNINDEALKSIKTYSEKEEVSSLNNNSHNIEADANQPEENADSVTNQGLNVKNSVEYASDLTPEIVAAITAAIICSLGTNQFVVKKIVRTYDSKPAWGKIGRIESINRGI